MRHQDDHCCGGKGGTHRRNVYLKMKTLPEARALLRDRFEWSGILGTERIEVTGAVGRVLAEAVPAAISSPAYHGAAMDGIAVRARATFGASDVEPMELSIGRDAIFVDTGEPIPPGMDAVVMIEHVQVLDEERVRIEAAAYPWQHVRRVGEDIVATEMLFARHHIVTPACVGALLAGGVLWVEVQRRPRVLIIPTGAELLDPRDLDVDALEPGRILEFNSSVLGGMVRELGGEATVHPSLEDDAARIGQAIARAITDGSADMVLVLGGSSAGSRDTTRAAIEGVGEVLVHGVTIMPGKPTVLGAVCDRPVVGIPGYPVSAIVSFEQFVAPALAWLLGVAERRRPRVQAVPTRKIASKLGMDEFVRVRVGRVGDRLVATPLARGAGTITSFATADGIVRVPADLEGLHAFEPAEVELLRPIEDIDTHLVAVGSHDMCLDVLADLLRARGAGLTLRSSHVGSLGGLKAVKAGACHLAGTHLLDPTDGSYNTTYIRRYLPDTPVRVVHLVEREQGLIVPAGNPLGIHGFDELARPHVSFVNRQGGSGTRVLLDYELRKRDIDPAAISGYETTEFTHMAVAVAVLSGAADAGLGIAAAARALGLDFVPVATETYELVIPEALFEDPDLQLLLDVIRSPEFARRVDELGGYDPARAGQTR